MLGRISEEGRVEMFDLMMSLTDPESVFEPSGHHETLDLADLRYDNLIVETCAKRIILFKLFSSSRLGA